MEKEVCLLNFLRGHSSRWTVCLFLDTHFEGGAVSRLLSFIPGLQQLLIAIFVHADPPKFDLESYIANYRGIYDMPWRWRAALTSGLSQAGPDSIDSFS